MARRGGKGRKRRHRRGKLSQTSYSPMDPEHARWALSSARESREAEEQYRQAKEGAGLGESQTKQEARKAVEVHVGNVPHGTLAPDLAKFLHGVLLRAASEEASSSGSLGPRPSVLRCKIQTNNGGGGGARGVRLGGRRTTFAFVALRSEELAATLVNTTHTFGGREIRINRAKGTIRKPLAASRGFDCGRFQLCAEWPPGELTCLWEAKTGVTLQVTSPDSLASLKFENDSGVRCQADFKRRHVHGKVMVEQRGNKMWLVFRLLRPPFLKELATPTGSFTDLADLLDGILQLGAVAAAGSEWTVDDPDGTGGSGMQRTGDVSPNGGFGRCLVYRVEITTLSPQERQRLFKELHNFRLCTSQSLPQLLRNPIPLTMHASGNPMNGWEGTLTGERLYRRLPYTVKYLIQCLTSNLKMDALGVDEGALSLLDEAGEEKACLILSAMLNSDPRMRLQNTPREEIAMWSKYFVPRSGAAMEAGRGNVVIPRVSVTPLRLVCQPPEQEMSNGVTRHFAAHSRRFLRVSFVDENMGRVPVPLSRFLRARMESFLENGITIAGRKYEFLAYSGSQLRTHSCFFYAGPGADGEGASLSGGVPTGDFIRKWMGDLSAIDVVGKHAARLGQSLSSTTSTVTVPFYRKAKVEDKAAGPYEFTDGCGLMSPDLARRVWNSLGHQLDETPPSAFQIRMGGCKGMLAVWPDSVMRNVAGRGGCEVIVRPSMEKFPSERNNLEVIQYARSLPCYLNRQFITLLSTLGVPDEPIQSLYVTMAEVLDRMVSDSEAALTALTRYYNSTGAKKAGKREHGPLWEALAMVKAGFNVCTNPFLQGVLRATRDKAMTDLRNRTRIFVPDAVCLLGVVDETGSLEPGQVYFSLDHNPGELPTKGFTTLPAGTPVLVCRNPSLHPGDLRVLLTADPPELRHLRNVVVFPCVGDRPEPSMMSGGDLDGDLYAVVWDETLLPPEGKNWPGGDGRNFEPMGYQPPPKPVRSSTGGVAIKEITKFFVNYVENDKLGMIANAHLVWADMSSNEGARCSQCIELAALHSTAVDFAKSGVPASFPKELRTHEYPDFMCKKRRLSYTSTKLIGRLFRMTPETRGVLPSSPEFLGGFELDASMLVPGWEDFVVEAEAVYSHYCQELGSLAYKYGVHDEGQLISGQVGKFSANALKNAKLEDSQARLNLEMAQLKSFFRGIFEEQGSHYDDVDDDDGTDEEEEEEKEGEENEEEEGEEGEAEAEEAPSGMEAYQKASAWYYVSHSDDVNPYLREARKEWRARDGSSRKQQRQRLLFLSFPWICAHQQLCQIKMMAHLGAA